MGGVNVEDSVTGVSPLYMADHVTDSVASNTGCRFALPFAEVPHPPGAYAPGAHWSSWVTL